MPATQLASMSNGNYFVQATITNYLGATASGVWAFTKAAAGTAPVIVPLASGTVDYKVAEGVRVGVQLVAASVCSGKQVRHHLVQDVVRLSSVSDCNTATTDLQTVIPANVAAVLRGTCDELQHAAACSAVAGTGC